VTISAFATNSSSERFLWVGWTGVGSGSYTGAGNNSALVTMNGPITETASWTHQYLLTLAANFGTTSPSVGTSWVTDGSSVSLSAFATNSSSERFLWVGWTGVGSGSYTGAGNNSALVTMNGPITETASWTHQYLLTLAANFGTTSPSVGTSWVTDGSPVTISAFATNSSSERFLWVGWTGSGSGSYTGAGNNSALVTMNGPITETASWTHQYLLTLAANFGTTSPTVGTSWVTEGSSVSLSAFATNSSSERFLWVGWTGVGSGSYTGAGNNSALVTMNGPITETASWTHQYLLTLAANFGTTSPTVGTSWVTDGSSVSLSAFATNSSSERFLWVGWTGSGTGSYSGAGNNSALVTMNGPITESASWTHQYLLTMAANFGTTSPAVGTSWVTEGSPVTISAFATNSSSERYLWVGWTGSGTGSYSGSGNNSALVTMNGPITESASWTHQYLLTVVGGGGVSYGAASPTGDNWYDSTQSTTVSSNGVYSRGSGSGQRVSSWQVDSGTVNSVATAGTVTTSSVSMSAAHTVTFASVTQYLLTVVGGSGVSYGTAPAIAGDTGWYDSSQSTTVSSSWVWGVSGGTRTALSNWQLDSVNQNPARQNTGTLTTSSVSMSAAHTVNFVSVTQYLLTNTLVSGSVSSVTASPTADSWYDSGSSVSVVLNYVWGADSSTRSNLFSYTVDSTTTPVSRAGSGTFSEPTITMSAAHSVSDLGVTQYFLTNGLVSGSVSSITASQTSDSWYDSGSSVSVVLNYVWGADSSTRSNLLSYAVDSVITSVSRAGSGYFNVPTITMSAAHSVGNLGVTQYLLTVSGGGGASYGTASPTGDNWYDSTQSTTVSSNGVYSRGSGSGQRVSSWQVDSGTVNSVATAGTVTTSSVSMSAAHTVTFASVTQYLLTVVGGSGVSYGTAPAIAGDTGWYDSSQSTTVSSSWVWGVSGGTRTALSNWQLDSVNQNPARQNTGTLTTSSVSMSAAHTVNFVSVTQYLLTNTLVSGSVSSVTASPTADSWYDSGSSVSVVLNYVWGADSSTRSNLFSYTVDSTTTPVSRAGSGTFSEPTITMSAAHSVSDLGVTQYFLTNGLVSGSVSSITASQTSDSWYDSGSSVSVVLNYVWGADSSTRSNLLSYAVDASTINVARSGSGTFNVPVITMSAAHSVSDLGVTQYFLTNTLIANSVNSITASQTSDSWYDSGSSVSVVLNYVWGADSSTRSNLLSYAVDASTINVARSGVGTFAVPAITMDAAHSVGDGAKTQYYLAVSSSHGSTTGQGWYDSGDTAYAGVSAETISGGAGVQYVFTSWGSDASGTVYSASDGITMNGPKTASATWTTQYTISASAGANGGISPSGSVSVNYGSDQAFTITANAHYHVADVLVDGVSVGAVTSYTFTGVTAAHTISATFAVNTYTITVSAGSNGAISPGTGSVNYGATPTYTITPATGYHIASITANGQAVTVNTPAGQSYQFSAVSADGSLTATFAINTYIINASAGAGGSISPTGNVSVNYGDNQTFTITANTGYYIAGVSVNGSSVGAVSSYTFTNVQAAYTISATFAQTPTPTPTPTATPTPTPTAAPTPTPTPSPSPTPSATTVPATTASGATVDIAISGNVTAQQMSNMTITPYQSNATTTVAFTVTGTSGTVGFGNMTIPKTAIPYGTTPVVYIDGQQAQSQGYSQDADNFYVWYTTHFSTHQVTIQFVVPPPPATSLGLALVVVINVAAITLIFIVIANKRSKRKPDNELPNPEN
jgi:hypothetical protein